MTIDPYQSAHAFAAKAHAKQKRKYDKAPYINHLEAVARIMARHGYDSPTVQAAALLHDTVEDTDVTVQNLCETFGPEVAELVYWLSDMEKGKRKFRKLQSAWRLARAPFEAKLIKCADFIDNSANIVENDPDFAPVYLGEKHMILQAMADIEGPKLTQLPIYKAASAITVMEDVNEAQAKTKAIQEGAEAH
jgi:(p)ppGpp synthase/HD superfamily hydrolase